MGHVQKKGFGELAKTTQEIVFGLLGIYYQKTVAEHGLVQGQALPHKFAPDIHALAKEQGVRLPLELTKSRLDNWCRTGYRHYNKAFVQMLVKCRLRGLEGARNTTENHRQAILDAQRCEYSGPKIYTAWGRQAAPDVPPHVIGRLAKTDPEVREGFLRLGFPKKPLQGIAPAKIGQRWKHEEKCARLLSFLQSSKAKANGWRQWCQSCQDALLEQGITPNYVRCLVQPSSQLFRPEIYVCFVEKKIISDRLILLLSKLLGIFPKNKTLDFFCRKFEAELAAESQNAKTLKAMTDLNSPEYSKAARHLFETHEVRKLGIIRKNPAPRPEWKYADFVIEVISGSRRFGDIRAIWKANFHKFAKKGLIFERFQREARRNGSKLNRYCKARGIELHPASSWQKNHDGDSKLKLIAPKKAFAIPNAAPQNQLAQAKVRAR